MTHEHIQYILKHFPGSKENQKLGDLTYIKIGGPARLYVPLSSKKAVQELITFALRENIPFYVLGKGCNIVFTDEGYPGIVVRIELTRVFPLKDNQMYAEAGATLLDIIFEGHRHNLVGMENLSGIPSSLGGAIFGNAGAGGSEMGDFVSSVEVLSYDWESKKSEMKTFSFQDMKFVYRGSKIKDSQKSIVLSAILQLKKGSAEDAKNSIEKSMDARSNAQPLAYSSAGCVFKNPPGESAGKLIEAAGLKGKKIGGVMISEKHGNFILNVNNGTFKDYRALVALIKKTIHEQFNINLELEHIIVYPE